MKNIILIISVTILCGISLTSHGQTDANNPIFIFEENPTITLQSYAANQTQITLTFAISGFPYLVEPHVVLDGPLSYSATNPPEAIRVIGNPYLFTVTFSGTQPITTYTWYAFAQEPGNDDFFATASGQVTSK